MSFLTWNGSHASAAAGSDAVAAGKANSALAAKHAPMEGYARVPPADVPHQSFKGYQLCANLEPETSELIGLGSEYPTRPYQPSYRLFEQPYIDKKGAFHSEQNHNLALFQKVDTDLGTRSYVVRAARDLKKGTPVCLVGGQLTELWKAEPHVVSECGYVMSPHDLHDYFYYPRDQTALVLLTDRHYNISKFVRDPSHRTTGEGPNVAIDLILHKKAKLFVLLLFTTSNVNEGEEIFAHRFLGDSRKGDHQNMVLAARVSHWYHRYAARLERAAIEAQLQPELDALHKNAMTQASRKQGRKLLTAAEQRMHMRGVDSKQKSVPVPTSISHEEMAAAKAQLQRDIETGDEPVDAAASSGRIKTPQVYHYFLRVQSDRLMAEGTVFRDGSAKNKHIADLWRALSEEEKAAVRTEMIAAKGAVGSVDHEAMAAAAARARDAMADLMPYAAAAGGARPQTSGNNSEANGAAPEGEEEESKEERKEGAASSSESGAATTAATATAAASSSASAASAASAAALARVSSSLGGGTSATIERDLLQLVSMDDAMRLTGCEAIPKSTLGESVTQSTRILMSRLSSHYPDAVVIDGQRYPFHRAKMEEWLASKRGFDEAALEVREIQSLTSPCRYFVPPWYKTYCVTSRMAISRASLLCIYSGEMEQSVQHRCSSYVYALPTSEGLSHFGKEYQGMPDLIVDAANKGNIGRFFNDNSFRNGEYQCEQAVNVGVTWVFDLIPHLVFYATRDIAPGEELISSYGKQFWDVMCRQALRGHSAYFAYIRPYTSGLEKLLKTAHVSLPPKPDYVIEREPLFEQKAGAYNPPSEDSDDDEEEEEEAAVGESAPADFTVERVVGKKFLRDEAGSVRYWLKWTGYPWEDNTWEPLAHLEESMEAVHEFEQRLKERGMDVGVEPLDGPQPDDLAAAVDDTNAEAETGADTEVAAMDVDGAAPARRGPSASSRRKKKGSRVSRKRQSVASAADAASSGASASPAPVAAAAASGSPSPSAAAAAAAAAAADVLSPVSSGLDAGVGAIDLTADESEAASLAAPKKRRATASSVRSNGLQDGAVASPPRKRAQRVTARSKSPRATKGDPAAAHSPSASTSHASPSANAGGRPAAGASAAAAAAAAASSPLPSLLQLQTVMTQFLSPAAAAAKRN